MAACRGTSHASKRACIVGKKSSYEQVQASAEHCAAARQSSSLAASLTDRQSSSQSSSHAVNQQAGQPRSPPLPAALHPDPLGQPWPHPQRPRSLQGAQPAASLKGWPRWQSQCSGTEQQGVRQGGEGALPGLNTFSHKIVWSGCPWLAGASSRCAMCFNAATMQQQQALLTESALSILASTPIAEVPVKPGGGEEGSLRVAS